MNEQLQGFIAGIAKGASFQENTKIVTVLVPANELFLSIKSLKDSTAFCFDFLVNVTGLDMQPQLGVAYHLRSTKKGCDVIVKSFAENRDKPELPSICSLYKGAELQEREVFDFFGIRFANNPDLRRIFLEDDWKGFPLRKDYKDEVNIIDLIK